jgi:antiviral helicase SKI2
MGKVLLNLIARGVPFSNICKLTDIQEGSIVRSITQIDQACRELKNCFRVIGVNN